MIGTGNLHSVGASAVLGTWFELTETFCVPPNDLVGHFLRGIISSMTYPHRVVPLFFSEKAVVRRSSLGACIPGNSSFRSSWLRFGYHTGYFCERIRPPLYASYFINLINKS